MYYAQVALGTPNATFLAVLERLDTGSDLFLVLCNSKQCAPLSKNVRAKGGLQLHECSPWLSSMSTLLT